MLKPCEIYHTSEQLAAWLVEHRRDRDGVIAARKKKRGEENRKRRHRSPSLRIRNAVQGRIWSALKGKSSGRLFTRLGYTVGELTAHLEARFQPGMTWLNYGKWHVDHRKPCAAFDQTDPAQFAECWALSNLQPLWAADNLRKGSRYGEA